MKEITATQFRANQGKYLNAALAGQKLLLKSRYGKFKIVPVRNETLTDRICQGLKEVKLIENGILPVKSAKSFLDEL